MSLKSLLCPSIGIIEFLNNEGWERISNMQIEITPRSLPLGRDWAHMNHFQWKSFRLNLSNSVTNIFEEGASRLFVLLDYIHSDRNRFIQRKWFLKPAHGPDGEDYTQHWIRIETLQLLNNNRYMNSIAATNSLQIYHVLYFMLNATQW